MDMIEHRVRERAYYIWEGEGRILGRAEAHWIQAETELAATGAEAASVVEKGLTQSPAKAATVRAKTSAKAAAPKASTKAKKASRSTDAGSIALH